MNDLLSFMVDAVEGVVNHIQDHPFEVGNTFFPPEPRPAPRPRPPPWQPNQNQEYVYVEDDE